MSKGQSPDESPFKTKRPSLTLDDTVKLIQILAIIGAGVWTLFEYLDYRRDAAKVDLKKETIEKEQAAIARDTLMLERDLKGIAVQAASQAPLEQSYELTVRPLQQGSLELLEATLEMRVTNKSEHLLILPEGTLTLFVGALPKPPEKASAFRLNQPPLRGPIAWKQVDQKKYVAIQDSTLAWLKTTARLAEPGGLAYGRLQVGEVMDLHNVFMVNATDDSWFGYTTRFVVRREGRPDWPYEYSGFVQIGDVRSHPAKGSGSPNPVGRANG
jgi:hypothetical protein